MTAGYSGTPLPKKLGIEQGTTLIVVDAPPGWVGATLELPGGVTAGDLRRRTADLILWFVRSQGELMQRRDAVLARLPADGALWMAWPKRSSGVATDVTEDVLRDLLLPEGIVDVKVAALDDTWSGLKFMVRKQRRDAWHGSG